MKKFLTLVVITFFCFSLSLQGQLQVKESLYDIKNHHTLKSFVDGNDSLSKVLPEQVPILLKYNVIPKVESKTYTMKMTPLVGPFLDVNREDKTQYVNMRTNEGWRLSGADESMSIYGKHYRKNKEKKGSRYKELRLYKMKTKKVNLPIANAEFSYDMAVYVDDIANVQSILNQSPEHYGFAVLLSEKKEGLNKKVVIVNDALEIQGKYKYVAKNKFNRIHGIVNFDDSFQGLSYTNSTSLLKNEPAYDIVNFIDSEVVFTSMNVESWKEAGANYYPGTINNVLIPKFDHLVNLGNGDILRLGYFNIEVPSGESTKNMHQDIFLIHSNKQGEVKNLKFYNNPEKFETSSTFYRETKGHFIYGMRHIDAKGQDKLLVIDKSSGSIEEYSPKGTTKDYFWSYNKEDNSIEYIGVLTQANQLLHAVVRL